MTRPARICMLVLLPIVTIAGCQPAAGGGDGDSGNAGGGGEMLQTAMDTIMLGRRLAMSSGCGDCHGGGPNPSAPNWLVGFRAGTEDTLFWPAKVPTPGGMMLTRPRNLTPDNETGIGRFTERQIFNALRYGLRPGETPDVEITGSTPGQGNFPANPKYLAPPMPWPAFRHKPDLELWALAAYLKRGVKPQANRVELSDGPPDFWAGMYAMIAGPYPPDAFPTSRETAPPPQ
jgi:hypothetical protein